MDCRTLSGRLTGDRTFTLGILRGLAELLAGDEHQVLAIMKDPAGAELVPRHPAIETIIAPGLPGRLWMAGTFPLIARRRRADVALFHYMGPLLSPCPTVTVVHDVVWRALPQTFPRRARLWLDAFLPGTMRRAAAVVTVSKFSRGEIARHFGVPPAKIHVVHDAVDASFHPVTDSAALAAVREKYQLPQRFILSIGLLQPRKNVVGLVDAYAGLPAARRQEIGLAIAGRPGWRYDAILRRAEAGAAPGIVRVTGYVDDEDLPALYSAATCLAYPSLYEGFGLPPLEAMACGTPVLCSNVTSLPEVVGDAALTVDPYDVDALRDGLERLLTDEALRKRLWAAGIERAKRFTWEASARSLLAVLRGAVSG